MFLSNPVLIKPILWANHYPIRKTTVAINNHRMRRQIATLSHPINTPMSIAIVVAVIRIIRISIIIILVPRVRRLIVRQPIPMVAPSKRGKVVVPLVNWNFEVFNNNQPNQQIFIMYDHHFDPSILLPKHTRSHVRFNPATIRTIQVYDSKVVRLWVNAELSGWRPFERKVWY